jgi:hypothetical protein
MTWADDDNREQRDLVRFAISGKGLEWARLQNKLFAIIDVIAKRVETSCSIDPGKIDGSAEALKDLSAIAANWARAKIEKPSLENEKLKAEIASEFAEAKRRWAEALKLEAETRKIEVETNNQGLIAALDNLERLLRIAKAMSHVTFQNVDGDGHLLIGPSPDQVGEADGDTALLGDTHDQEAPPSDA